MGDRDVDPDKPMTPGRFPPDLLSGGHAGGGTMEEKVEIEIKCDRGKDQSEVVQFRAQGSE